MFLSVSKSLCIILYNKNILYYITFFSTLKSSILAGYCAYFWLVIAFQVLIAFDPFVKGVKLKFEGPGLRDFIDWGFM